MKEIYNSVIGFGKYLSGNIEPWLIICIAAGVVIVAFLLSLITISVTEAARTKGKLNKLNNMCEKQKHKPQELTEFTKKFNKAAKTGYSRPTQAYSAFLEDKKGTVSEAFSNQIIYSGYPKFYCYVGICSIVMSILSFIVLIGVTSSSEFALHLQNSLIFPFIIVVLGFILDAVLRGISNGIIQGIIPINEALKRNLYLIYKGDISNFNEFISSREEYEKMEEEARIERENKLNKAKKAPKNKQQETAEIQIPEKKEEELEGLKKELEEPKQEASAPAFKIEVNEPAVVEVKTAEIKAAEVKPAEEKITNGIDSKTVENIEFRNRRRGETERLNLLEASLKFETEKEKLENELKNNRRIYEVKDQEFDDELKRNKKELEIVRNNKALSKDVRLTESFREQEEILYKRVSAIERLKKNNKQSLEEEETKVKARLAEIDREMELKRQEAKEVKQQTETKKTVNEMLGDLLDSMDKYKR